MSKSSEFVIQMELDEVGSTFTTLPPLSSWLCDIVYRKSFISRNFMAELCSCIDSGAVADVHNLHGASHFLATVVKCKPSLTGTKDCWTSVHKVMEKLKNQDPAQLDGGPEEDALKQLEQKLSMVYKD